MVSFLLNIISDVVDQVIAGLIIAWIFQLIKSLLVKKKYQYIT